MAREKPEDIEKKLREQDNEFYGEGTISGSAPDPTSDDDIDDIGIVDDETEDVLDEEVEEKMDEDKPFTIAEEIEAGEFDNKHVVSDDDASEEEQEVEEDEEEL